MAVVVNHTSKTSTSGTATSISWSHTATGDNFLVVFMSFRPNVTGLQITYNSIAMTQIGSTQASTHTQIYMFGLANPTTGTNTIAASWTTASQGGAVGGSVSGYVSTGTAGGSNQVGNGAVTMTATIGANDLLIGSVAFDDQVGTKTISTGTVLASAADGTFEGILGGWNTGSGSVSIVTNTLTGTDDSSWVFAPLLGPAATTRNSHLITVMGMGS